MRERERETEREGGRERDDDDDNGLFFLFSVCFYLAVQNIKLF